MAPFAAMPTGENSGRRGRRAGSTARVRNWPRETSAVVPSQGDSAQSSFPSLDATSVGDEAATRELRKLLGAAD